MNKKLSMLMALMICGQVTCFAETENQTQDGVAAYELPSVNVTAVGYSKSNLDTPADVTVYTGEELEKTGAANVADALKYKGGVYFTQMGPHGQNWITNSSKINLRGIDNGTLVLVDGVPASFNGVSHLDNIDLAQVEKVEVVKGGGAVLYGSEAFGGVVNVITKNSYKNQIRVAAGNEKQKYASISTNIKKLNIFASHDEYGETGNMSVKDASNSSVWGSSTKYRISFGKSKKDNVGLSYKFNDKVKVNYNYHRKDYSMNYNNTNGSLGVMQHFDYKDEEHQALVNYGNKDFAAKAYFNQRDINNPDIRYVSGAAQREWEKSKQTVYGFDVNQKFGSGKDQFLIGAGLKHEIYTNDREKFKNKNGDVNAYSGSWNSNEYSIYGQYDKKFSKATSLIIGVREDIAKFNGESYNELLPQIQLLTKFDENNAMYFNAGKSFKMPNFRNLYYASGMIKPNPDLKPESAVNCEVGYKYADKNSQLTIAAFKTQVKDQIVSMSYGSYSTPENVSKYRNRGVEINYKKEMDSHFGYNAGAIFSKPERKYQEGTEWENSLGRCQLNSGVNYNNRCFEAALSLSYWTDRVTNGTKTVNGKKQITKTAIEGPLLISNLHLGYKVKENLKLTADINNLFNRKDIGNVDTSSSMYYIPGRTFLIGMNYSF